jgi:hypothetical protein
LVTEHLSRRDDQMNLRRLKGYRVIAVFLLFAIVQIGMQIGFAAPTTPAPNVAPLPQQFIARLTTRNNQPITVNGNPAATGTAIVTGATIETGADQSATVNLGPLGTLDIAPNTKLVLTYDEQGNVKAVLVVGCLILTAKKKSTGEVATEQTGSAGKTDPAKGGVIDICFPPGAAAPIVGQGAAAAAGAGAGATAAGAAAAGGGGLFGLGTAATIAILAGIGSVAAIPAVFQSNPSGV